MQSGKIELGSIHKSPDPASAGSWDVISPPSGLAWASDAAVNGESGRASGGPASSGAEGASLLITTTVDLASWVAPPPDEPPQEAKAANRSRSIPRVDGSNFGFLMVTLPSQLAETIAAHLALLATTVVGAFDTTGGHRLTSCSGFERATAGWLIRYKG